MTASRAIDRENKDARINVRLAPSQASLIRRAAEASSTSVSEFVIGSAAVAAEQVLADDPALQRHPGLAAALEHNVGMAQRAALAKN